LTDGARLAKHYAMAIWRNILKMLLVFAAASAAEGADTRRAQSALVTTPMRAGSELERIMGKDARTLVQLLGQPVQDVREDAARKLQFANADCVLDAYLYPPGDGRTPVVTYVAARVPDGRDAERNSCIAAIRQRR
jgi:hypothetical protein